MVEPCLPAGWDRQSRQVWLRRGLCCGQTPPAPPAQQAPSSAHPCPLPPPAGRKAIHVRVRMAIQGQFLTCATAWSPVEDPGPHQMNHTQLVCGACSTVTSQDPSHLAGYRRYPAHAMSHYYTALPYANLEALLVDKCHEQAPLQGVPRPGDLRQSILQQVAPPDSHRQWRDTAIYGCQAVPAPAQQLHVCDAACAGVRISYSYEATVYRPYDSIC